MITKPRNTCTRFILPHHFWSWEVFNFCFTTWIRFCLRTLCNVPGYAITKISIHLFWNDMTFRNSFVFQLTNAEKSRLCAYMNNKAFKIGCRVFNSLFPTTYSLNISSPHSIATHWFLINIAQNGGILTGLNPRLPDPKSFALTCSLFTSVLYMSYILFSLVWS